jgi:hypothetical protein
MFSLAGRLVPWHAAETRYIFGLDRQYKPYLNGFAGAEQCK